MPTSRAISFEFKNQVSPRYIQPLFLHLQPGEWYESPEMQQMLRDGGLNIQGEKIVGANTIFWTKVGLGERQIGKTSLFRLSPLGIHVKELFSTNQELFFDVIHFLFYSAWRRSGKLAQVPFWLYAQVCDTLWQNAPGRMDSMALTRQMQEDSRHTFPKHDPNFPERSVRSIFPWLGMLTPPFLSKCGAKSELCSERRITCTPQLFHLAVDLLFQQEGLQYGTSLTIDEQHITAVCQTCLLATDRFWEMASLTDMAIRELEVRQGQWGTSLALSGPPRWINLPDFADEADADNEEEVI